MKIVSAASAFPDHVFDQPAVTAALRGYWGDAPANTNVLERLHAHCKVDRRHFVLPLEHYEKIQNWGEANNLWIENALQLGERAIGQAAESIKINPKDLSALFFVSVTGIASPSIDARLMNRMKLSPHLKRIPIFGLGCVAGAAGIARASDYVRAFPNELAVVLAVELCSLTWQRSDQSIANLISSGLFGDGAAAVILAGSQTAFEGPQIIATRSTFYPDTEDVMGWDISERGFQIVLSEEVPAVIRQNLGADVDALLAEHRLKRGDIESWIIHTGGPKVLDAVHDALGLPKEALDLSWESLRQVGNLSSASVLVVLEKTLKTRRGRPGSYSVLAAMGPGFCSEIVLIRW